MAELTIPYLRCNLTELSSTDQHLVQQANNALVLAHAPYSRFRVGASLIDETGKVTLGNNQENAAYPSGLCAERVAFFSAKSQSASAIHTLVVVAKNTQGESANAFCCGGCRQVIVEYASLQPNPIRVIMGTETGEYILLEDAHLLMPFGFNAENLR